MERQIPAIETRILLATILKSRESYTPVVIFSNKEGYSIIRCVTLSGVKDYTVSFEKNSVCFSELEDKRSQSC